MDSWFYGSYWALYTSLTILYLGGIILERYLIAFILLHLHYIKNETEDIGHRKSRCMQGRYHGYGQGSGQY
jgi:hypothetical protein